MVMSFRTSLSSFLTSGDRSVSGSKPFRRNSSSLRSTRIITSVFHSSYSSTLLMFAYRATCASRASSIACRMPSGCCASRYFRPYIHSCLNRWLVKHPGSVVTTCPANSNSAPVRNFWHGQERGSTIIIASPGIISESRCTLAIQDPSGLPSVYDIRIRASTIGSGYRSRTCFTLKILAISTFSMSLFFHSTFNHTGFSSLFFFFTTSGCKLTGCGGFPCNRRSSCSAGLRGVEQRSVVNA